jgi:hypothetical protein
MANGLFGGGDGTAISPYIVQDAHDLWAVRNNLSAHYVQVNNIDLNVFVEGNGWEAIGQSDAPFTGLYNGNNFEIKNLWSGNITGHGGLFGYVTGGFLHNIILSNVILAKANLDIGALVGYITNASENAVVNCHATGIINEQKIYTGTNGVGGLIGRAANGGIKDSSFTGIVRSYGGYYAGGLVGVLNSSTQKCWANAEIDAENTIGVGGFAGYIAGSSHAYNYAITNIISAKYRVGGFAGEIRSQTQILNCWARGKVQGTLNAGGFAGVLDGGLITNCYAATFLEVEGDQDVGGFVGWKGTTGTVNNCVWDKEVSGVEDDASGGGAVGKTTAEMKNRQTYIDLGWSI